MDDAIPFAGLFILFAFFAWTTWPQRELLAIALVFVAVIIVAFRAVELA